MSDSISTFCETDFYKNAKREYNSTNKIRIETLKT